MHDSLMRNGWRSVARGAARPELIPQHFDFNIATQNAGGGANDPEVQGSAIRQDGRPPHDELNVSLQGQGSVAFESHNLSVQFDCPAAAENLAVHFVLKRH